MDPINIPPMLAYIPAPWILWVLVYINHVYCCVHARHEHDSKARLKNMNQIDWLCRILSGYILIMCGYLHRHVHSTCLLVLALHERWRG